MVRPIEDADAAVPPHAARTNNPFLHIFFLLLGLTNSPTGISPKRPRDHEHFFMISS